MSPQTTAHPNLLAAALQGVTRRHMLFALLASTAMVFVGLFVAGIGLLALKLGGGAAHDTGLVVLVGAFAVTDFWGGGILAAAARLPARQSAAAWTIARTAVLALLVALFPALLVVAPVQLVLAVPAAYFGARLAHKQAAMRRAANRAVVSATATAAAGARDRARTPAGA